MNVSCSTRSWQLFALGFALLTTTVTANAQTTMRVINPALIRQVEAPQPPPAPPPSDSSASTPDASGCAPNRKSSGLCFANPPSFDTYTSAAASCASYGGRLPTLGELIGYRAGPGDNETGIECSSDFDTGSGTLWCVGDHGAISGVTLENQAATLSKKPAMFRCVKYLKQN